MYNLVYIKEFCMSNVQNVHNVWNPKSIEDIK